ncbi:hypothetical protein Y032_0386g446 [Ancylostoma ceylanicum]|nr:hypothetical protein Y032_0386g446 [Ancylostoma ceylanicum]
MDLRSDLEAVEGVVNAVTTCVDKVLDTLDLIPPIVDSAGENNVSRGDIERLELAVKTTLQALGMLSNKVYTLEDLVFFLKRAVDADKRSDNKPTAPPKVENSLVQDPSNMPDENDIDNCTAQLGDCSLEHDGAYVGDDDGVAMVADTPQRGRRRSKSATRMIKKVFRRLSHSRSRLPKSSLDLGQHDADVTLPLEK